MSPAPAAAQASVSVSLFDLKADTPVLQGLRLVSHAPGEALAQVLQTSFPGSGERISPERKPLQGPLDISEKLFCSTCDQTFQNHQNREHYKLDWHQFNLKQHLKDKPLLCALDFEKQSSTGDLSSISGSEDSDLASEEDLQILDEERAEFEKPNRPRGFHPHRVLFQNAQGQFLYAYCCVLGPRQVPPEEAELLLQNLQSGGPRDCVVLVAAAGHFAGAVFKVPPWALVASPSCTQLPQLGETQDSRTQPPYTVAADKSTRNEFRRFMEKNPDAYDYSKAQVPGPLTAEMEAQQAIRKREQKAARRQWEERQAQKREQEEQRRFAALSD
ncbi:hypothetical protein J1605_013234 [Eschrichtius robustus]|uniref:Ankyrin repeat and zinc finger domain-containing protein 1 n=1 Tax=Eschrichtius robustus TaxID=9764 RepID=A0AB34GJJ3_ESCRO|nr:hypothetical protein J1605_013234 [Eschrichtius robustus]